MKPNGIVFFAQALASICHWAASPPPWINGGGATICGWTEMKVQPAVGDMASASAASVLVNRGLLRRTDGAAQTQGRRRAMGEWNTSMGRSTRKRKGTLVHHGS